MHVFFFPLVRPAVEEIPFFLHKPQDEQSRRFGTSHTCNRRQGRQAVINVLMAV